MPLRGVAGADRLLQPAMWALVRRFYFHLQARLLTEDEWLEIGGSIYRRRKYYEIEKWSGVFGIGAEASKALGLRISLILQ